LNRADGVGARNPRVGRREQTAFDMELYASRGDMVPVGRKKAKIADERKFADDGAKNVKGLTYPKASS
jgi:hypothetical protein